MNASVPVFTAREIADALAVTAQAVRARLVDTPAIAAQKVGGQDAAAWSLEALPAGLREDLAAAWKAACTRTAATPWRNLAHFVKEPPVVEKPRVARAKELPMDRCMFDGLRACLAMFADATRPTAAELAWLWNEVFTALEAATSARRKEKKAKRALLRWLSQQSFLAGLKENLRRDFNRKLARWRANGRTAAGLADQRAEANAARRVKLSAEDRGRLVATGLFKHGREAAPAWRECMEAGTLTNELCTRHVSNPSRRSYVPKTVMREIRPELKALWPWRLGPRQAKLNGAFIPTIHDEAAGDWFTSDDFTLEVYFYILNDEGWFDLTRGQWLPMVDCRSKKILDFILIPEKRYTGAHIRTLINHCCTEIGLPRRGFHFERGTWLKSKLVGGALPWGDVQLNFAQRLGLEMQFAKPGNAKAKIVENVGKLFQASLRDVPGWAGPNEQVIKIESVQAAKRAVEAPPTAPRSKHPAEAGFLSFDEFFDVLHSKVERYNATPQESVVSGGGKKVTKSPDEAWQQLQEKDTAENVVGLVKLPPDCRYLLAARSWKATVGRNGVSFQQGKESFMFRDGLAALQCEEVTCHFDPELPKLLFVVTADKRVFTVPRVDPISRFNATPGQLEDANRSMAAWNRTHSARLAQLRHDYMPPARANIVAPAVAAVGQAMATQRQDIAAKETERRQITAEANRIAWQRGWPEPTTAEMANHYLRVAGEPEQETAYDPA